MQSGQNFSVIPGAYAVCHLPAKAPLPAWPGKAFTSVTRTADELSISTFDTDYILVKRIHVKNAITALRLAGHTLVES
jgi:hypothetical protein